MQWFKHDTNANQDTRIKRLRNRYGLAGYGLYFYVLERVVAGLHQGNVSLTLEDDPALIAADWGIAEIDAREMLQYMVELDLLAVSPDGLYACPKVAKRLDKSMTNGRNMRELVDTLRCAHGYSTAPASLVMTMSGGGHDKVMLEKKRTEQNRPEERERQKSAQIVSINPTTPTHNSVSSEANTCIFNRALANDYQTTGGVFMPYQRNDSHQPITTDWQPSDQTATTLEAQGIPAEYIRQRAGDMAAHYAANGKTFSNWDAKLVEWVRRDWPKDAGQWQSANQRKQAQEYSTAAGTMARLKDTSW